LSDVSGKSHNFTIIGIFQPGENDRGIQATRIG